MANSYNSNPIVLNVVMASGWRALQTLATKQIGIRPTRVLWTGMAATGHTFSIVDPNDGTVLLQGQAGNTLTDQEYFTDSFAATWRDFKLSQISSGNLLVWYRQ